MDHGYWSWRFNWFYVFDKQLKAENLANRVVLKNTSEKHLMKLTWTTQHMTIVAMILKLLILFFTIKMIKNGPLEMLTVYIYLKFKVQNNLSYLWTDWPHFLIHSTEIPNIIILQTIYFWCFCFSWHWLPFKQLNALLLFY